MALEEYLQQKVNDMAVELAKQFPEIAENNPLEIGRMAKQMVLDMAKLAVEITRKPDII